jgi:hypothetical protein
VILYLEVNRIIHSAKKKHPMLEQGLSPSGQRRQVAIRDRASCLSPLALVLVLVTPVYLASFSLATPGPISGRCYGPLEKECGGKVKGRRGLLSQDTGMEALSIGVTSWQIPQDGVHPQKFPHGWGGGQDPGDNLIRRDR